MKNEFENILHLIRKKFVPIIERVWLTYKKMKNEVMDVRELKKSFQNYKNKTIVFFSLLEDSFIFQSTV